MKLEKVLTFTEKEEELATLLTDVGLKRNVAKVLVYLANTNEATSRDIERGTDLRQPEVSIAMRTLNEKEWIENRESKAESKGRPVKIYCLSKPAKDIIDTIESDKKEEIETQLKLIQKIREILVS
ncbi:ArsR family transcriptional regulator [Methanomicrobium antiquum]|uniref:ArsR family transcriptional regulator n=1 Tax=Methanomicrobium antiquum TaxID=487686 RepID=A0AAF0FW33_9EURY|nr:helix-turn-helix domain-containing protein [Methanomicrobium antiquum]MDD3976584.1 helix-turn-helix domain-containing protein [Methanomicrobium sp.]WFN36049.1 ArsR family transcriptional regulator [Methanomicrobium antiquum]